MPHEIGRTRVNLNVCRTSWPMALAVERDYNRNNFGLPPDFLPEEFDDDWLPPRSVVGRRGVVPDDR